MSSNKQQKRYLVGIDVGIRSLGLAAIEVDKAGVPINVLNALSLVHDAGLDPNSSKKALTRKSVSGVARRTRRMYRERKKRLSRLDTFLAEQGFPLNDLTTIEDFAQWKARAALTSSKIADPSVFQEAFSMAIRHIARHRGWRNPYSSVESLYPSRQSHSPGFESICEEFRSYPGVKITTDTTIAELVVQLKDKGVKYRGENGLFSERLHQKDLALEIHKIAEVQGLSRDFTENVIQKVFAAKSPKGSAEKYVGLDELDRTQKRASRANLEFQQYRIIALLANVRVAEANKTAKTMRPLTVPERETCFRFLDSYTDKQDPTWSDIANLIGVDRGDLRGTATSTDDGERTSARPPINETNRTLTQSNIKEIRSFWKEADIASRKALLQELSNVDAPAEDSPEAIAASTLLRTLSSESLDKLEDVRLPDGRSAYSERTLSKLKHYMLTHEADLSVARTAIFGVPKDWKPTPPPIHEPTGNPAVDRVLKAVNRWLLMAENRWGAPLRVNIETMRAGFKSERLAREIERDQIRRAERNNQLLLDMQESLNIQGKSHRSELIRFQALQRQNGQCAYCGTSIDFKTMELDHIVPRSGVGSTNARVNLLATCGRCNREKSNLPFSVWASTTTIPTVSVESAIQRVKQWVMDPGMTAPSWKKFQSEVVARLRRTSEDEELDARSKESVSWMAIELRSRIEGHYEHLAGQHETKTSVFRGEVTAAARRAAGIERSFRLIGGKTGKNRLDRRHHAIDAAVIALMKATVAQILIERNSLQRQQQLTGHSDPIFGNWKSYYGRTKDAQSIFEQWKFQMHRLARLLQSAVDQNQIPVTENTRLKLGNALAHEERIRPLQSIQLGNQLNAEVINRSATPALWTALTRHPDHDWVNGLPEDPTRTISVNGTRYNANDEIQIFPVGAGCIKVREGYAELGPAFHHARLYKITTNNRISYSMMRVYTVDLLQRQDEDLFNVELPHSCMSVRQSEDRLRTALRDGNAEFITWFVVGDELQIETSRIANGQVASFLEEFGSVTHWRIRGFPTVSKLRLKPAYFSAEGLDSDTSSESSKIINQPGWRPSIGKVFGTGSTVLVRRDAHGRIRGRNDKGLPRTVKIGEDGVANT